jgi:hypothetical protein
VLLKVFTVVIFRLQRTVSKPALQHVPVSSRNNKTDTVESSLIDAPQTSKLNKVRSGKGGANLLCSLR